MKPGVWLVALTVPAWVGAEETVIARKDAPAAAVLPAVPIPDARETAPRAWLGLRLTKPDETTAVHLPSLPPGIGFVVKSVDKDGPAESAGLRPLDVFWKFGDQMLVNEAQLATLLGHHLPGQEVALSIFRSGRPLDLVLKLGEAPDHPGTDRGDIADAAMFPDEAAPMKLVNVGARTASYTGGEGSAWVRREPDDTYHVTVKDAEGSVIFTGKMQSDVKPEGLPDKWHRRVCALRRGLDHALDGRMTPVRPPRPRVVPPPADR